MHFSRTGTFRQLYQDLFRCTGTDAEPPIELLIKVKNVGGKPRIPRAGCAAKQLRVQHKEGKYVTARGGSLERGIVGQPQIAAGPPDNGHEPV
ncbi:hypothetical protein NJBCHELONAE_26070 [Mycobacteroides chelonae]|nr:hypothetical protein NJBCHELONAE_26070 [Mycobacteroides chelonae]